MDKEDEEVLVKNFFNLAEAYRLLKANDYPITGTDCYSKSVSFLKTIYVLVPKKI